MTIPMGCARSGGAARSINRVNGYKESATSKEYITLLMRKCGINTIVSFEQIDAFAVTVLIKEVVAHHSLYGIVDTVA